MVLLEEAEEGAGRELKRSRAEWARAGLDPAGPSLLFGTHPARLDTAGLGAGASNTGYMEVPVLIFHLKVQSILIDRKALMCKQ